MSLIDFDGRADPGRHIGSPSHSAPRALQLEGRGLYAAREGMSGLQTERFEPDFVSPSVAPAKEVLNTMCNWNCAIYNLVPSSTFLFCVLGITKLLR